MSFWDNTRAGDWRLQSLRIRGVSSLGEVAAKALGAGSWRGIGVHGGTGCLGL